MVLLAREREREREREDGETRPAGRAERADADERAESLKEERGEGDDFRRAHSPHEDGRQTRDQIFPQHNSVEKPES